MVNSSEDFQKDLSFRLLAKAKISDSLVLRIAVNLLRPYAKKWAGVDTACIYFTIWV